ncbi:MAG: hypothetical protein HOC77_09320 [Chloroflexi bacterium]|nr:hypothetical protein [Chloroflexota bacterium]MBT4074554.1 hypothetical protein [Chloroflexota bacterium]MBT4515272.1 hypothetical protein [Chloroflexota bacterium]MBT5318313.1 hypothetical protein [Chloroflexota bacterium]MBT6681695.1 hypothetical protein [Chloroflexota bacterium]
MIPAVLSSIGTASAGAAIAPALRVLTIPLLLLTVVMLTRAWRLELKATGHWQGVWAVRSRRTLLVSTILSIAIWGMRFGGLLGPTPF